MFRSSVLDAVGAQIGLNPPIIGTLRDQQAAAGMKGAAEEGAMWSKHSQSIYPYTTFGIKSIERYIVANIIKVFF